jgi:hypothetical protein
MCVCVCVCVCVCACADQMNTTTTVIKCRYVPNNKGWKCRWTTNYSNYKVIHNVRLLTIPPFTLATHRRLNETNFDGRIPSLKPPSEGTETQQKRIT